MTPFVLPIDSVGYYKILSGTGLGGGPHNHGRETFMMARQMVVTACLLACLAGQIFADTSEHGTYQTRKNGGGYLRS